MSPDPSPPRRPSVRRPLFWILLILFAAGCVSWLFYVPGDEGRLWRTIPSGATVVTRHQALEQSWTAATRNPALRACLAAAGVDVDLIERDLADPDTEWLRDAIGSSPVLTAYHPALGHSRRPAWIVSGWLGGKSHVFRWLLLLGRLEAIPDGEFRGRPIWRIPTDARADAVWRMAVVDGGLVGAYSADPAAIRHALDAWDGLRPRTVRPPEDAGAGPAPGDRAWFRVPGAGRDDMVSLDLQAVSPDALRARVTLPARWSVSEGNAHAGVPVTPPAMLDRRAVITCAAGRDWLADVLGRNVDPIWREVLSPEILGDIQALSAGLLGDPFRGRIRGFQVPTLMVAARTDDPGRMGVRLQAALDRLNARFHLGLISRRIERDDGLPFFVIETVVDQAYAEFPPDDRLALVVIGDWALLSSNRGGLERLLQAEEAPAAASSLSGRGAARPAQAYARLALPPAVRMARNLIGVYRLKLMVEGDINKAYELGERLSDATPWLTAASAMGELRLWLDETETRPEITAHFGAVETEGTTRKGTP